MHIQFSAEEDLGPEGRVDCPVVPGGEQGGSHIVDQVHHLHLQARTRVIGAREGRTQDPHIVQNYLGQSKTLFGCQVVQKPTEVIKIFLTALQLVSMCSSMDRCRQKAPRLTIRRVIWILAFDTEYLYLSTQPTYLQILRGQCCFDR